MFEPYLKIGLLKNSIQSTTQTEAKNAFKIAKVILNKIEEILCRDNPQLRLDVD